jgi:hypothetical protein
MKTLLFYLKKMIFKQIEDCETMIFSNTYLDIGTV